MVGEEGVGVGDGGDENILVILLKIFKEVKHDRRTIRYSKRQVLDFK